MYKIKALLSCTFHTDKGSDVATAKSTMILIIIVAICPNYRERIGKLLDLGNKMLHSDRIVSFYSLKLTVSSVLMSMTDVIIFLGGGGTCAP